MKNYNYIRWHGKEKVEEFLEKFGVEEDDENNKELRRQIKKLKKWSLHEDPIIFRTE